jgi:hypothetical protein
MRTRPPPTAAQRTATPPAAVPARPAHARQRPRRARLIFPRLQFGVLGLGRGAAAHGASRPAGQEPGRRGFCGAACPFVTKAALRATDFPRPQLGGLGVGPRSCRSLPVSTGPWSLRDEVRAARDCFPRPQFCVLGVGRGAAAHGAPRPAGRSQGPRGFRGAAFGLGLAWPRPGLAAHDKGRAARDRFPASSVRRSRGWAAGAIASDAPCPGDRSQGTPVAIAAPPGRA